MATSSQFGSQLDPKDISKKSSHLFSEELSEPVNEYFQRAKDLGMRTIDRGSMIVKENPGYTILGAAAVGFLLGAYVARRR